jgi:hypothetical protein
MVIAFIEVATFFNQLLFRGGRKMEKESQFYKGELIYSLYWDSFPLCCPRIVIESRAGKEVIEGIR